MAASIRFFTLFFAYSVLAVRWNGPFNTDVAVPGPNQLRLKADAPAPTDAPKALARRDDVSPNCGYLRGSIEWDPCEPFSTCIWRTDISVVGCCRDTTNLNTCQMYTSCVDYIDIPSSSPSTSDSLVLICTDSVEAVCGSIRYQPSYYNYVCSSKAFYWDISLQNENATTSESGLPRYAGPVTISTSTTYSSSLPVTTPSSSPAATTKLLPSPSSSPSHKSDIGPIAGGVVGGIVALSAIAVILRILHVRHEHAKVKSEGPIGNGVMYYGDS